MAKALVEYFDDITDPRIDRTKRHSLKNILTMALCAVIGGAEGWEDIELFCKSKSDWLHSFLDLPNGIPSDDTFRRVLSRINPIEFQKVISKWILDVKEFTQQQISIDGKTLRRSFEHADRQSSTHLLNAWAVEKGILIGQMISEGHKNEIKTIPQLLKLLDISDCLLSLDAMGCQKDVAEMIIRGGGDYLLALKGNQSSTKYDVEEFFKHAEATNWKNIEHHYHETTDGDHGRIEFRQYWVTSDLSWITTKQQWAELKSIAKVQSTVTKGDKTYTETRYYLSSLEADINVSRYIRNHWAVENSLHWVLDMSFREDESRIRKDHGAENFSWLRKFALNLIKQSKDKGSIKGKRKRCGWDNLFLEKILTN